MNIQEFSRQLRVENHPSELLRLLQFLRDVDVDLLRRPGRMGPDWGVWNDQEPRARAERPERQS